MVAPARPTQTDHFELVLKVVSPFQSGEPAKPAHLLTASQAMPQV
jgi:hypothetical protein